MSNKTKGMIAIASVLLIALIVWTVNSIPKPPADDGEGPAQRIVSFDGNTISEERNGKLIWKITAERIEMNIDNNTASLINLKAVFNMEDGRTVDFSAPKAVFDQGSHNLKVEGGIKGSSSDGASFSCDSSEWIADNSRLSLIGNVMLERASEGMKATGERIESTDGFSRFVIKGKAHLEKGN